MKMIEKLSKEIDYLPPFPLLVRKAFEILKKSDVRADSVADVIKLDQGIATNVLRLCNSSYFGLKRSITSVREAVVYLGFEQVRIILILSSLGRYYDLQKEGYESGRGELWRHSIAVSVLAKHLSGMMSLENREEVFMAGLLHDVGKLILSEYVHKSGDDIRDAVTDRGQTFLAAEKAAIGYDHAEIGAMVLAHWGFPPAMVSAIRKHHAPFSIGDDSDMDNCIRLADTLSMFIGYQTSKDGLAYNGFSGICRHYKIERKTLDATMAESLREIVGIETEFGLVRED